ncbi:carboxymuconolactone decarboxylase family protein [Rhodobacteraceae bacterium F11138]|nr:carboxymuconolactone decarboxylase family protein [Rhodobacteraceae bacterium F11138]
MTGRHHDRQAALVPVADEDWPEDLADMLAGFAGGLNVYRTMAHHPALLRAWASLRDHVVNKTVLGAQGSEVVILRTGHRLGSSYEWAQHILRARKCGMADERIASIAGPPDAMAAQDAILARAVDELYDTARLCPETRAGLEQGYGVKGVFDVMATVGFYSTLGFILNTFDTPLDADARAELNARPLMPR